MYRYADQRNSVDPRIAAGVACLLMCGAAAWSQEESDDLVDRTMHFIERASEATELFNAEKLTEALAVFRELNEDGADLDEDGLVGMGVGDCLAGLGRTAEAREAYVALVARNPDLTERVGERLTELELAGEVSDELIARLRRRAGEPGDAGQVGKWRLARARQKRARAMLAEAAETFRSLVDLGWALPPPSWLGRYTALLEELSKDLGALIGQLETRWQSPRVETDRQKVGRLGSKKGPAGGRIVTERIRTEVSVRLGDEPPVEFGVTLDKAGDRPEITADGKPVKLTDTQRLLLQYHRERMSAILLEAAGAGQEHDDRNAGP